MKRVFFVLFCCLVPFAHFAHSGWRQHAHDIVDVLGIKNTNIRDNWAGYISAYIIDSVDPFSCNTLQKIYPGFIFKHRLLFHWGYNAKPWNKSLEMKFRDYCEKYGKNVDKEINNLKILLIDEQQRRNRNAKDRTRRYFGFFNGGRESKWANFFTSMAYNIHLIGDYTSDNKDLDGLPNLTEILGLIVIDLRNLDSGESKSIISGMTQINHKYANCQSKADKLMNYLKATMPDFMRRADSGRIYNRLKKRGIYQ